MENFKISGFDHCELYVGNAKQSAYYYQHAFGFKPVSFSGLETGNREKVSYVMQQNQVKFVLSSPLIAGTDISKHIDRHGDGVKDISFSVDDAEKAWKETTGKGAKSVIKPKLIQDSYGEAVIATIQTYGDTTHTFIDRSKYQGTFLPGYENIQTPNNDISTGIIHIDHIVGNQPDGDMKKVCEFYEKTFGWHRFWSVDDKDVSTKYSSLRSIVMSNENEKVKMPINEPANGLKKSQIQEYIDFYNGPGVQHISQCPQKI